MTISTKEYRDFSWDLHAAVGNKPIVAQMELTYRCPLHCRHCYSDCYNMPGAKSGELSAAQIKLIMDKCKEAGVLWFCFTGGDPLAHKDFCDLYLYAKKIGFITTVFTPLVAMTPKIFQAFMDSPPFGVETTLNAVSASRYEAITGTRLLRTHIRNIKRLLRNHIPVKVKTQITKQNMDEIRNVKKQVQSWGLDFVPTTMLWARLNHDCTPCSLRLDPAQAVRINKKYDCRDDEEGIRNQVRGPLKKWIGRPASDKLLTCAAGGYSFWISPQGRMFLCEGLAGFDYDLLPQGRTITKGFYDLNRRIHGLEFQTRSRCRLCEYRRICHWCPGRAYLETGSREKPIEYFCQLTEEMLKADGR